MFHELLVHLGPAISQSVYEVGNEVKTQFLDRNSIFERSFIEKNGKPYLNLYDGAKVILEGYGITSISGGNCCTYKDSKQFFSFRRDGECSGRMALDLDGLNKLSPSPETLSETSLPKKLKLITKLCCPFFDLNKVFF